MHTLLSSARQPLRGTTHHHHRLPQMAVLDPPVRFDVRMPLDLAQDMQDLEQSTGLSRGEIFRRAMALYKRAKETQSERGNVLLRDSDGTLREVIGI